MKVQILNPMPWSALRNADGTVQVVLSAGPRESMSLKLSSLQHLAVLADFLSSALHDFRAGLNTWQSPQLHQLLEHDRSHVAADKRPSFRDRAELLGVTEDILTAAGLRYDPKTGWFGIGDRP